MRKKILTILIGSLIFIGGLFIGYHLANGSEEKGQELTIRQMFEVFNRTMVEIERKYVKTVKPIELIENALKGMVNSLDPYSEFLTPKEYKRFRTSVSSQYSGVGMSISMRDGYPVVMTPFEGAPAWRAGIMAGDIILKVNGESVEDMSLDEIVEKIKGPVGTKVTLTIWRKTIGDTFNVTLTREKITIHPIPFAGVVEKNIGYIKFSDFSMISADEISAKIDSLKKLGVKKIILDIRNNPGGLLNQVVDIADLFLPENKLIVYTKGRRIPKYTYYSVREGPYNDLILAILVNRGSASASEILSGALQDWDRAIIIGDTTFGKGSVQRMIDVGYGYKLRITVSKYYLPSGRCIEKFQWDKKKKKKKRVFFSKILKRKLHGEGGICPDIVITSDTISRIVSKIRAKGLFFEYAVKYRATHKKAPNLYKPLPKYILNDFKKFLKNKKFKITDKEFNKVKKDIDILLRMELAEKYYGMKGRYKVLIRVDPVIKKGVEVLRKLSSIEDLREFLKKL